MNKNFITQNQYGIEFQYSRNLASPLDPHSVITSYADLTGDFLKQVNTYPGQLVALADDISNPSGFTVAAKDRQHQGLYWVTNGDNAGKAVFTTYKLATTYESNISYEKIWNTVKIAYTKTFEPWASYITTFNNNVVGWTYKTIASTINPAVFGSNWKNTSWESNKDSLMYKMSYVNTTVFAAVDDLHNYLWNTISPTVNALVTYTNKTLGPAIDTLEDYTKHSIAPSLSAAISYEETTRNMLIAMLPDMPYYKPKYSDFNFAYAESGGADRTFNQTYSNNTTYNYFCVEYGTSFDKIPQFNIKFGWKNTVPFVYADKALYTYIENNSKFPAGVNLTHLGYTNLIGSQTRTAASSLDAVWGMTVTLLPDDTTNTWYISTNIGSCETSAPTAAISSIGKYDNQWSRLYTNRPYYFNISNSSSMVEHETTMKPLCTYDGGNINFSGIKRLVTLNATIYYSGPQKTFYDSLAKKNIFIESTANMWDTDAFILKSENKVNVKQAIWCYSGFKVYYGLFNLTSDVLNTGSNYSNIIKYIINGGSTKPSSFNKSTVKSALVTYASDSGLPRSLTAKYFGSSEMGVSEWGETTGRNCCFIGFPTNFFKYTQLNTDLKQVWEGKFSGTGAWGTFGAAGTDPQNYIIDNVSIQATYRTMNYTFIIAKTTLPFKFGSSNSGGYGLRLTCQQYNLNNYTKNV